MSLMEWIPLLGGGAVIYWGTTRVANGLLRRAHHGVDDEDRPAHRSRELTRPASRFSLGLLARASASSKEDAKAESKRKSVPRPPLPVAPEPFDAHQRSATNRDVAAKIERIAAEVPGPDTLSMDQAVTQPIERSELEATTREAHELVGQIQSLDFTLDDRDPMGDTAIVDIVTLQVDVPKDDTSPGPDGQADIGATLVLDTEELLKAIRGGPPTAPSEPVALTTAQTPPAGPPDWEGAMAALRDSSGPADASGSFFDTSAAGRDMGTTQLFRLEGPLTSAPPVAAEAATGGPGSSPVSASVDASAEFAAPDLVLPDFSLPEFATTAGKQALDRGARSVHERKPRARSAESPRRRAAAARRTAVDIGAAFHRLAVAHDDIQAARVAFESLLDTGDDPSDPSYRVLLFGAIVAYTRPFQSGDADPLALEFSSERFAMAHEELLEARERLLRAAEEADDQVVRLDPAAGDAGESETAFAVQTDLLNDARLPMYVALCNFLEAQLLELLQSAADPALDPQ